MSDASKAEPTGGDEPVPKLPRGRGLKLSGPELFRIALTIVALIGVVILTKPCAKAVSGFVTSFDNDKDSQKAMPKPGNVDVPRQGSDTPRVDMPRDDQYEHLTPGMTEQEIKAAMERSKARNAAHGAGSAAPSSGSAAPSSGSAPPSSGNATP